MFIIIFQFKHEYSYVKHHKDIKNYSDIYLHVLLFNFMTTFSFRMLCLKNSYNMDFKKNLRFLIRAKTIVLGVPKFKTKTFIFEYFPKIPSEMNSKHPFYSILIPMTSHAKIFILVVGGP